MQAWSFLLLHYLPALLATVYRRLHLPIALPGTDGSCGGYCWIHPSEMHNGTNTSHIFFQTLKYYGWDQRSGALATKTWRYHSAGYTSPQSTSRQCFG